MSGHSKWATIKRQKAVTDAKRGTLFTKLAKNISLAARLGKDAGFNPALRTAIDKARQFNMPKNNIERAILRGAGELPGQQLEEITYEGYGPEGVALLIEVVTDNKNRTAAWVKSTLDKYGGNMGTPHSVNWMFAKKGVLRIENKDEASQLKAIDLGALDVIAEEGGLTIYTTPQDLEKFKKEFPQAEYGEIEWVATNKIVPKNKEALEKLFAELEGNEDISNFYSNADF